MPIHSHLMIWNQEGIKLEGSRENGSSPIFEHSYKVFLPFDESDSRVQGSRRFSCFSIIKEIDKLTPQLIEMVCNGRICKKVLIALNRIGDTGQEEEYFHYILEDAKIISVESLDFDKSNSISNTHQLEMVKIIARKYEWIYLDSNIAYTEEMSEY